MTVIIFLWQCIFVTSEICKGWMRDLQLTLRLVRKELWIPADTVGFQWNGCNRHWSVCTGTVSNWLNAAVQCSGVFK